METAEIRRRWLAFFEKNGHTVVPSAPLVHDDPNLLFVNAGMVPFKPYFLGQESPSWARATSVQKCVRTGDIEEVGKTSRHGTFFQMNGNFSFGDYFKEGAISLAWELITTPQHLGGYGLDADLIWPTVYEDDDEAFAIWRDVIGIPSARITRRGKLDNYWHMGVPGPAGPCSEIYLDRGPEYGQEGGPAVDEDRYLEFWNLVFMQEELSAVRAKDDFDIVGPLPKRNIDTGMGLERMATLLQGVDNLYEIDEVYPVLERAAELTGKRYGEQSGQSAGSSHPDDVRLRVVADHVRSSLMLIGDGVTPGNEGRGYVLRRMLRRSVRSMRLLGYDDPCLPELLPVSLERMQQSYPELESGFDRISQIAYAEEEAFRRTLAAGTTILETRAAVLQGRGTITARGQCATPGHLVQEKRQLPLRTRSSCTTPTASPSTSPSRWRRSRASRSTVRASRTSCGSSASGRRRMRRRRSPAMRTPRCGVTCARAAPRTSSPTTASAARPPWWASSSTGRPSPRSSRDSGARSC